MSAKEFIMSRTCFSYLRASTNISMQSNSIAVQRAIIARFVETHGYELKEEYVEYESGKNDERVEFNKALKRAIDEDALLITWKVDRLSRSLSIFNAIQDHLHLLRFAELGNTEPNIMVLSVLLGVAHQERINCSERVKATYRTLKAQNPDQKWGNPRIMTTAHPLGLAVRKSNAAAFNARIKNICQDFEKAGYCTLTSLAVKLSELGITTRRGNNFTPSNLRRVLNYGE